eukprot:350594-Chlamydomonas_euryale.AAC.11
MPGRAGVVGGRTRRDGKGTSVCAGLPPGYSPLLAADMPCCGRSPAAVALLQPARIAGDEGRGVATPAWRNTGAAIQVEVFGVLAEAAGGRSRGGAATLRAVEGACGDGVGGEKTAGRARESSNILEAACSVLCVAGAYADGRSHPEAAAPGYAAAVLVAAAAVAAAAAVRSVGSHDEARSLGALPPSLPH